jgi:hypothetical protein
MTARLQHRISPDGETVTLVVGSPTRPLLAEVSPDELRRFAWAVLSDLDPDEAEAANVTPISGSAGMRKRGMDEPTRWMAILIALAFKPGGKTDLSRRPATYAVTEAGMTMLTGMHNAAA